jgi:hypothetical protein
MARALLLVLAVFGLAVVAPAEAAKMRADHGGVTLVKRGGKPVSGRWQEWADAALMPTVVGNVKLRLKPCPALRSAGGCVQTSRPRKIYIRPDVDTPRSLLLHELGHVYDLLVLSRRDRRHFKKIFPKRLRRGWWHARGVPMAEWFAESYSFCARYEKIRSLEDYASYRYRPKPRHHRKACALIERAAIDSQPPEPPRNPPPATPDPAPKPSPPPEPGVVPGDPERDPGPQDHEDPDGPVPGLPAPAPTPPVPLPTPPVGAP